MSTRVVEREIIDDKEVLLTPAEVCQRLNVTRRWLRRAREKQTLPVVKVGGLLRYPESGIVAYIEANREPAAES